jgi:hypothetical protein
MSKPVEKKTEHTSPSSTPTGHSPETKKTDTTSTKGGKVVSFAPGACHSGGCKHPANRMEFCSEHYDQFKFGLIKKTGEPVPDYEKKLEHYTAYKNRTVTARKAA